MDRTIQSAQQLKTTRIKAGEVATAPPALLQRQGLPGLTRPEGRRQALAADLQGATAGVNLQLGMGQGLTATALSRQKSLRQLSRHHRPRLRTAVAGGQVQALAPAVLRQRLRQGRSADPDHGTAAQPGQSTGILQQPLQLRWHQ